MLLKYVFMFDPLFFSLLINALKYLLGVYLICPPFSETWEIYAKKNHLRDMYSRVFS